VPYYELSVSTLLLCRSQLPCGLRRRSAAVRLLRLWAGIPSGAWTFVCCECCVLSDTGLCDELITRPEESYRVWCVVVCASETSWMRGPWPTGGTVAPKTNKHTHKTSWSNYLTLSRLTYLLNIPSWIETVNN